MNIGRLVYNWAPASENYNYEVFLTAILGEDGVVGIHEHLPQYSGDVLYYDIDYGSHIVRVFNPNLVTYEV